MCNVFFRFCILKFRLVFIFRGPRGHWLSSSPTERNLPVRILSLRVLYFIRVHTSNFGLFVRLFLVFPLLGKEDPWQGQQIPQTYRPMGSSMHMGGGQHLQQPSSQQQRMMYQYPTMGQVVGVPGMQLSSPYGQQGQASPVMLQAGQPQQQQRYMYMQQSPTGPQGQPGAYYSPPNSAGGQQLPPSVQGSGSGELSADPVSPMYGSQHSPQDLLVPKPASQEGEYGRNSPPPGQGLEVLPPAQQQFPLDSESSHVRPPEGIQASPLPNLLSAYLNLFDNTFATYRPFP